MGVGAAGGRQWLAGAAWSGLPHATPLCWLPCSCLLLGQLRRPTYELNRVPKNDTKMAVSSRRGWQGCPRLLRLCRYKDNASQAPHTSPATLPAQVPMLRMCAVVQRMLMVERGRSQQVRRSALAGSTAAFCLLPCPPSLPLCRLPRPAERAAAAGEGARAGGGARRCAGAGRQRQQWRPEQDGGGAQPQHRQGRGGGGLG